MNNILKIKFLKEIQENFTGIVEWEWLNGYRAWFQNDHRHRIDGPAVVFFDNTKEYYLMNYNCKTYREYIIHLNYLKILKIGDLVDESFFGDFSQDNQAIVIDIEENLFIWILDLRTLKKKPLKL